MVGSLLALLVADSLAQWAVGPEGFEAPALTGTEFEGQPVGGPWTMSGGAGFSRNGSGFTSGNPPAPEGLQVLYLQGGGSTAELNAVFGPGNFKLRVMSAQRGNMNAGGQTFRIRVDGVEIAQITPAGSSYEELVTTIFPVTGGSHSILLEGVNPLGGDNTAFVDDLRLEEIIEAADPVEVKLDFDLQIDPAPAGHPAGSAMLTWWAGAGADYLLDRSLDLMVWTNMGVFTGEADFLSIIDEQVAGETKAFWRAGMPIPSVSPSVTAMARYSDPFSDLPEGGFEDPSISGFEYEPVISGWTMVGGAGIAENGSGFTSLNPDAPEGTYVAFLQTISTISGQVDVPEDGLYRLLFQAAQRERGTSVDQQRFRVTVGGMEVAELEPAGSSYEAIASRPVFLSAGMQPVVIESLNPLGTDNTAFIDELRLEPLLDWSDPSTWVDGHVPDTVADIFIPTGSAICLNGSCVAATVRVEGELLAAPVDSTLTARWVMLDGLAAKFEVGTHGTPFEQAFTLTLIGQNTGENMMGGGSKFLMAMNGGLLDLHGTPQVSWTKLASTASIGSTSLVLNEPVGWRIGDQIVISSSGLDPNEAEVRTIVDRPNSTTATLNTGLSYRHFGDAPQTYTRASDGKTWTLDQRCEVGLLTHNVKVQGDSSSEIDGFGGHLMVMKGGQTYGGFSRISNIELYRMGQKGILARYPMHWHVQEANGAGQFIEDSSVHRSFSRAVTIHGTDYARVERVVAYDHMGHGIFFEDGSERFNKIYDNLVLFTRRPAPGDELVPTDNSDNEEQNRTPASYWISNPNNEFIGNVAAGTEGTGYWFALHLAPTGISAGRPYFDGLEPFKEPLGAFHDNIAHSCMMGLDINDQINMDLTLRKNGEWGNAGPFFFDDLTMYANRTAIYAGIGGQRENVIYRNNVLADNLQHSFLATYQKILDSVLVADSGNGLVDAGLTRSAILLYDGAARTEDCFLVGFDASNASLLMNIGASSKHPNTLLDGITYDHAGPPRAVLPNFNLASPDYNLVNSPEDPRIWGSVVRDVDGSTTGTAGRSIIGNHTFMHTGNEVQPANWTRVFHTANRFAHLRLSYDLAPNQIPDTTWTREKAGTTTETYFYGFKVDYHQQIPVIVGDGFTYSIEFSSLPISKRVVVLFDDATAGDDVLVKFVGLSNLSGLSVPGMTQQFSLNNLKNVGSHSYYKAGNGDLWLKIVATEKFQGTTISWN